MWRSSARDLPGRVLAQQAARHGSFHGGPEPGTPRMRPSLTAQIGVAAGCLTAALLPPIVGDAALVETAMPPPYVTLQEQNFRTEIDAKPVDLYTIRNPAGMEVRITNYGARVEQ